jgi:hypothetical protein
MTERTSPRAVASARFRNHGLGTDRLQDALAVVKHLGAVQAQELVPAAASIAQRTASATAADVVALLDAGRLVRTHVMRPTWHIVEADDIRCLLRATRERVLRLNAPLERRAGIDAEVMAVSAATIAAALANGAALTREELGRALTAAGIATDTLRLSLLLMRAEFDALIVSGPMRGTRSTYALFDARVPSSQPRDADEALPGLTRRYLSGHGPATAKDLAWWAGLTITQARRGIELTAAEWESRECDGVSFIAPPAVWEVGTAKPVAHLLAAFDEFLLAYPASRSVSHAAGLSVAPSIANRPLQAIVIDGQVVGEWTRARVGVDIRVVADLNAAETAAVDRAVAEFSAQAAG